MACIFRHGNSHILERGRMKDYTEYKRGFVQLSKAWYGKAALVGDEIDNFSIGFFHEDNYPRGNFTISYEELGGMITPKLEAFGDSWAILSYFPYLLKRMAELDDKNIPPDELNQLLVSLGIKDQTPVENPHNDNLDLLRKDLVHQLGIPDDIDWDYFLETATRAKLQSDIEDKRRNLSVHKTHCCKIHGCKYNEDDCPVVLKKVEQSHPCEECQK